jgi:hypothetical protein
MENADSLFSMSDKVPMTLEQPRPPLPATPSLRAGYNSEVPDTSKWQQFDREIRHRHKPGVFARWTSQSALQFGVCCRAISQYWREKTR